MEAQRTNVRTMKLMNTGQVENSFQCPDIHSGIFKLPRTMNRQAGRRCNEWPFPLFSSHIMYIIDLFHCAIVVYSFPDIVYTILCIN